MLQSTLDTNSTGGDDAHQQLNLGRRGKELSSDVIDGSVPRPDGAVCARNASLHRLVHLFQDIALEGLGVVAEEPGNIDKGDGVIDTRAEFRGTLSGRI